MIVFPPNPTNGQQFTAAGVTWQWDGVKWVPLGMAGAFLPLSGGTLTGPLTLNANPTAALQAATKAYVDGSDIGSGTASGGFVNAFRNASMDIWQRPQPINLVANTYAFTADGWEAVANGAGAQASWGSSLGSTRYSLVVNGAAGITSVFFAQHIESYIAAKLAGKRVTMQFRISNNSGQTVTPSFVTVWPNNVDNWAGATTNDVIANFQSVPSSPNPSTGSVVVAYTFDVAAGASNGYGVQLQLNGPLPSGWYAISEADIRVTPGWPVGLCANPDPPELRSAPIEMVACQRYFQVLGGDAVAAICVQGYAQANEQVATAVGIPQMRAVPTATFFGAWNATNVASSALYPSKGVVSVQATSQVAGFVNMFSTANSGIYLTAEI